MVRSIKKGEYPGIKTVDEFNDLLQKISRRPTASKALSKGRKAYWDEDSGTVIIFDPANPDLGTAFRPTDGRLYFDNLK